jgi:hypothetical protein
MQSSSVALLCGFLGTLVTAVTIPSQVTGQAEIPTEKLVYALRLLNTEEYSYRHETGRFASRDELLTFLRTKGLLSQSPADLAKPKARFVSREEMSTSLQTKKPSSESPIDFENPKPYELTTAKRYPGEPVCGQRFTKSGPIATCEFSDGFRFARAIEQLPVTGQKRGSGKRKG